MIPIARQRLTRLQAKLEWLLRRTCGRGALQVCIPPAFASLTGRMGLAARWSLGLGHAGTETVTVVPEKITRSRFVPLEVHDELYTDLLLESDTQVLAMATVPPYQHHNLSSGHTRWALAGDLRRWATTVILCTILSCSATRETVSWAPIADTQ